jgi:hypothetical protein
MSKKKGKKGKVAAKKAPKKKAAKKAVKKASRALTAGPAPERTPRTKTANIFIFKTDAGVRIRTSPQRLYANPGDHVEFNVVNMVDGSDEAVTIEFAGGGPWGKDPFQVRNWDRKPLTDPALGRFKYTVSAYGYVEDPEIEMPDGN